MCDCRRITLFCLEKRLSKHKMTIFSKNLGGHGPFAPPACAYEWMKGLQKAKSDEMVPGCRQQLGFPRKLNYYLFDHLQYSLKFVCKSIGWYLHQVDKLTSKKYAKIIDLLCTGNKVFVTYQIQRGGLTPTPLAYPLIGTLLMLTLYTPCIECFK